MQPQVGSQHRERHLHASARLHTCLEKSRRTKHLLWEGATGVRHVEQCRYRVECLGLPGIGLFNFASASPLHPPLQSQFAPTTR